MSSGMLISIFAERFPTFQFSRCFSVLIPQFLTSISENPSAVCSDTPHLIRDKNVTTSALSFIEIYTLVTYAFPAKAIFIACYSIDLLCILYGI
jgi:hypothetical protein